MALFGLTFIGRSRAGSSVGRPPPTQSGLRRLRILVAVIAVASLGWSIYSTNSMPTSAFFSTFARAWELALGAALAIGASRLARVSARSAWLMGWFGLVGIGVAGVLFSASTPIPGYAALLPTLGAALVIAAGIPDEQPRFGIGRLLALAPLRYVGDRSYTLYLWHWPVLIIAVQYEGHQLSVGVKLLLALGAFILSIVTYRYFENPIRRGDRLAEAPRTWLRRRLRRYGYSTKRWIKSGPSRRTLLLWPASTLAVLFIAEGVLYSIDNKEAKLAAAAASETLALTPPPADSVPAGSNQAPPSETAQTLPAVVAAVKAAEQGRRIPSALNPPVGELLNSNYLYSFPDGCAPAGDNQTTSRVCPLGNTSGARSIVVMGDSHAQMWMPTILSMAQQDGWRVLPIVKSGCSPNKWVDNNGSAACRAWYSWAVRQVKTLRPDVTLVTGAYGGSGGATAAAVENGLFSFASSTKRSSTKVVVIGDTDGISQQPVDCLLGRNATMGTCTPTGEPQRFKEYDHVAGAAQDQGLGFVGTRGWFCFENQCPMVVGHTIVYRDEGHITKPYAEQISAPFRAAFRRAIRIKPAT